MPLKIKLTPDEHTALPEPQRTLYVAKDDAYVLDVDTDEVEATFAHGLKNALKVERDAAKAGRRAQTELDKLRATVGTLTAAELAERIGGYEALQANVTRLVEAERAKFGSALRDAAITEVVAKHRGNLKALQPLLRDRVRVDASGRVQVLGDDGQPTDGTLDAYVESLRADESFGALFAGSGNSGTGAAGEPRTAAGTGKPAASAQPGRRSQMTSAAKAAYMREHGSEAYLQLPL